MFATFVSSLGIVALFVFLYLALRNRPPEDLDHLASRIRPVNVDAFLNLTDKSEEEYLRKRLPAPQFRKIQRERILAAIEYVRVAGKNASVLVQLAEAAKRSSDPEIALAGQKLLDGALRLRLYALATVPQLYFTILVPRSIASAAVAESYASLVRQVVMLGCLRYPTHDIASAL